MEEVKALFGQWRISTALWMIDMYTSRLFKMQAGTLRNYVA